MSLSYGNPAWRSFSSILLLGLCPLFGRKSVSPPEHFGPEDGLSHPSVYAILQDRSGFLWFGSANGLNRFDGYRFKSYFHHPHDPASLSSNSLSAILEDEDGFLWLGSWGGGLVRFDPVNETFRAYRADAGEPESLSSDFIQCLFLSASHTLWVGTLDGGVNRFDRESGLITQYRSVAGDEQSLADDRIWSFAEDPDGRLWIGTDHGLNRLDPVSGLVEWFPLADPGRLDAEELQVRHLLRDRSDKLWVGTQRGLVRIHLRSGEVDLLLEEDGPAGMGEVNTIYEDHGGRLWVGTHFNGLKTWDPRTRTLEPAWPDIHMPSSDESLDVRTIAEDRSGNLWVGTRRDGIFRLDLKPHKFRLHRAGETIPPSGVSTLTVDGAAMFWLGSTEHGLTRWDRKSDAIKRFRHQQRNARSLAHDHVTSLALDGMGTLWVGTLGGLNRLGKDGESFDRVPLAQGDTRTSMGNQVFSLLVDDAGFLWVGGRGGVSRHDGESFKHFRHITRTPGSPAKGWIHCIYQGHSRTIWLGSNSGGLSRYDPAGESFTTFLHDPGDPDTISNNVVFSLAELGGFLWVGTAEGLNRLDPDSGKFHLFMGKEGLAGNAVYAVMEGENGMLWLSTNRGLSRFDTQSKAFRNYDSSDGLQGLQFFRGSAFRSAEGELFFGGQGGLNSFFAAEMRDHFFVPRVAITRFHVLDQEHPAGLLATIPTVLGPNDNLISFEFAVFDYTNPHKNRFAYMLEGFDADWVDNGTGNTATYANLPTGDYLFQLKATNHDGLWTEYGTRAHIIVRQPWYQSRWFFAALGMLPLGMIAAAIFLRRTRKGYLSRFEDLLRSKQQVVNASRSRSAFLTSLSHELRTPLNAIIGYSEILSEEIEDCKSRDFDVEQCLDDLSKIKSSAYYQLAQVNNLLELAKIDGGKGELFLETFDIRDMVGTVLGHIHPMLEKTGNRLEVKYIPEGIGTMVADLIKVQGILLNLLTNANNFTQQGNISLVVMRILESGNEIICFKVKDTGIGIPPESIKTIFDEFTTARESASDEGPGLGLYISRHFSKLMGGYIGVESQVSLGAIFSVYLPAVVTPGSKSRMRHSDNGSGKYSAQTLF